MWQPVKRPSCGMLGLLLAVSVMISSGAASAAVANTLRRPDGSSSYYIVTRMDPRMCPTPLCGGYFVKAVNKPKTQCADGSWQQDCHAVELDLSARGWSDDQRARFSEQFGQQHALVRGQLRQMKRGTVKADVLVVDEGWLGQALSKPAGAFYGVKTNGIVYITFPYPTIYERTLNVRSQRTIAEIDLAASGAGEDQIAAGYQALAKPAGILAAGENQLMAGPVAGMLKLVASEFYLPVVAKDPPEGQFCGGIQGLACPVGQFCDIAIPNSCGGADLSGTCRIAPQVCTENYLPVCGCDGVTYGNDCARQAARMQLDHPGECAKP